MKWLKINLMYPRMMSYLDIHICFDGQREFWVILCDFLTTNSFMFTPVMYTAILFIKFTSSCSFWFYVKEQIILIIFLAFKMAFTNRCIHSYTKVSIHFYMHTWMNSPDRKHVRGNSISAQVVLAMVIRNVSNDIIEMNGIIWTTTASSSRWWEREHLSGNGNDFSIPI